MAASRKRPGAKPRAKPGPKAVTPTNKRDLVTMGIAIGLTRDEIAEAIGMPLRSLARTYAHELRVGRSQRRLANAVRLDKAAEQGNVAAMKALMILFDAKPEPEAVSKWDGFADRYRAEMEAKANLARNTDF